jgi:hypothetical protein
VTRTSLPIAAVVTATAAAALLLTACGGGGSDSADKIQPSGTGTPSATATSASPSATASDHVDRPSTTVPKDLTMVFDWPKTGDATKDAVLNDGEQYVRAYNRAAAAHNLKDPAYQFYSRDDALTYAHDQIKVTTANGWAPTGYDRYYSPAVSKVSGDSATLSFCEDQTKTYSKVVKTGKVLLTSPSSQDFAQFNLLLFKDAANGVWQSSKITVVVGAAKCVH